MVRPVARGEVHRGRHARVDAEPAEETAHRADGIAREVLGEEHPDVVAERIEPQGDVVGVVADVEPVQVVARYQVGPVAARARQAARYSSKDENLVRLPGSRWNVYADHSRSTGLRRMSTTLGRCRVVRMASITGRPP